MILINLAWNTFFACSYRRCCQTKCCLLSSKLNSYPFFHTRENQSSFLQSGAVSAFAVSSRVIWNQSVILRVTITFIQIIKHYFLRLWINNNVFAVQYFWMPSVNKSISWEICCVEMTLMAEMKLIPIYLHTISRAENVWRFSFHFFYFSFPFPFLF